MLAALTTFMIGAAIALVVSVITPGSHGETVGWMVIGGVAGMLIGVPLWSAVWRREQQRRG